MNYASLVTERQKSASDSLPRELSRSATVVNSGVTPVPAQAAYVRDTAVVDLGNWHSMQYWAKWLGISEHQLVRAIRVAGTNVATIEAHLAERRARRLRKRAAAAPG
jgi:hypothetical protein